MTIEAMAVGFVAGFIGGFVSREYLKASVLQSLILGGLAAVFANLALGLI